MNNLRIVEFYTGRYGFKSWYELQRYNPIYKHWYCEHGAIELKFIKDYCILNNIDSKSIPIKNYKTSENEIQD